MKIKMPWNLREKKNKHGLMCNALAEKLEMLLQNESRLSELLSKIITVL